jgi:hypothetical protein
VKKQTQMMLLRLGLFLSFVSISGLLIWSPMKNKKDPLSVDKRTFDAVLKQFVEYYDIKKVRITENRETSSRFRSVAEIKSKFKALWAHRQPRDLQYVFSVRGSLFTLNATEHKERVSKVEIIAGSDTKDLCAWIITHFRSLDPQFTIAIIEE